MNTEGWAFLGAKTVFAKCSPQLPGCDDCWLTFLLQWGQQISMEAEESTKDRFPSFPCIRYQIKFLWYLLKLDFVSSLKVTWSLLPTSGCWLATLHGHTTLTRTCKTAAKFHEPTTEEFLQMKMLQTAQGFYDTHSWPLLTSSLGCCFLLSFSCQRLVQSYFQAVSVRGMYTQPSN